MNNLIGKCFKYKSLLPNLLNGTYEIIDRKGDKVIARKLQQFVAEDFIPKEFDLKNVELYLKTKEIEVNAKELSQIIDGLEHINHNKKINFEINSELLDEYGEEYLKENYNLTRNQLNNIEEEINETNNLIKRLKEI